MGSAGFSTRLLHVPLTWRLTQVLVLVYNSAPYSIVVVKHHDQQTHETTGHPGFEGQLGCVEGPEIILAPAWRCKFVKTHFMQHSKYNSSEAAAGPAFIPGCYSL